MIQKESQEREMSFDEAIALLKQHKSITNLVEAVKRKIIHLESMLFVIILQEKLLKQKKNHLIK